MKRIQGFKIEFSEVLVTAKWSDFREGAAMVPSSVVKSRLLLQLVALQKDGLHLLGYYIVRSLTL